MKTNHATLTLTLAALGLGSAALALTPADEALLGFENLANWEGLQPEATLVKEGAQAARWTDTPTNDRIRLRRWSGDLSAFEGMQFWAHSEVATGAKVAFVVLSENPATVGPDYWQALVPIDWTGWKLVEVPFASMRVVREPVGLHAVSEIMFASTGYSTGEPDARTVLVLDGLAPMGEATSAPAAAAPPADAPPPPDPQALATLLGFEDATLWRGLVPGTAEPREGLACGLWQDLSTTTRIECPAFTQSLEGVEAIELWVHAETPKPTAIVVIIGSENEATSGDDYYRLTVPVAWQGWKRVRLDLSDFQYTRAPKGWGHITGMRLASSDYSLPGAAPGTRLRLDGMELVRAGK
jgi:hypothetical protein